MSAEQGELVITCVAALVLVEPEGSPAATVLRGETLPAHTLPGEAKRLAGLGVLGRRRSTDIPDAGAAAAGFVDEATDGGSGAVNVTHFDIEGSSIEELAVHLESGKEGGKPFTIPEVTAMAVSDDPATAAARARKLLDAEGHRSGGDPRDGLTSALVKLIEADPAS